MQLLLPQLFFEWKKAVSTHRRHFVVKKRGVKITFERFLHQSGFQGDNGPMGFKEIFQNPKIHIPISDL